MSGGDFEDLYARAFQGLCRVEGHNGTAYHLMGGEARAEAISKQAARAEERRAKVLEMYNAGYRMGDMTRTLGATRSTITNDLNICGVKRPFHWSKQGRAQ